MRIPRGLPFFCFFFVPGCGRLPLPLPTQAGLLIEYCNHLCSYIYIHTGTHTIFYLTFARFFFRSFFWRGMPFFRDVCPVVGLMRRSR